MQTCANVWTTSIIVSQDHGEAPTADSFDCTPVSDPPVYSTQHLCGYLPSSDPADPDFLDEEKLYLSTSRLYALNYLEGPGRLDSNVDSYWIYNEIEIGSDLMEYRNQIVENNGGLTEPHQML